MQTIHIIAPGNLKEAYWRDACAEYCKRLRPYAAVQIHELREAPLPAQPTPAQIQQALQHEGSAWGIYHRALYRGKTDVFHKFFQAAL